MVGDSVPLEKKGQLRNRIKYARTMLDNEIMVNQYINLKIKSMSEDKV